MSDIITRDGQQVLWYPQDIEPAQYQPIVSHTRFVRCPHCKGADVIHIAAVTAGDPQPEETLDCELCGGLGDVAASTAALYLEEGLDEVLAMRSAAS
jgi:hypothetical protein